MSRPIGHERAFELLPWLVNGSLSGHERDEVEQHTRVCLLCRRELERRIPEEYRTGESATEDYRQRELRKKYGATN